MNQNRWIGACLLIFITATAGAQESKGVSLGFHILAGGRYDNVRMCVGSPAGVPGGPIGEIYVDVRFPLGENGTVALNIPLFRPIVFAFAFDMIQIEPLVMYEHRFEQQNGMTPVVGAGLGMVFHYGPDYRSSADKRGESFFSIGPLFSGFAGLKMGESNLTAGIKGFISPLFTRDQPSGIVVSGGLATCLTHSTILATPCIIRL